ncbi:MAG: DMP19 family protein [Pedobacter sp.]|uniref:DMP19 family protein n=1 Tax=Pedobacter sp. TaxID=1411316 RepID=UPI003561D662
MNTAVNSSNVIEAQVKRPPLTVETIDGTPDSLLVQLVFDHISNTLPTNPDQELASVLSLTKPQQAIYIIWWLEAEVNNGGFNQYYYNSSGQFAKLAPNVLRLVGANKFAELTQTANNVFEKEKEQITKDQNGTSEGFSKSYDNNPLEKFDNQFYALKEPLMELQVAFIRKNKKDFVTPQ